MQAPEMIEAGLERLMPRGFSDGGLRSIEEMLDELGGDLELEVATGGVAAVGTAAVSGKVRFRVAAGIAAAVAGVLAVNFPAGPRAAGFTVLEPVAHEPLGLVLIGETNQIEEMSDAGWVAVADGRAMEATLVRMVEANTYVDEETGVVVEVSEPREEILLTPISAF